MAAVASAVLLFTNPPLGLALGIASGVSGLATTGGDLIATNVKIRRLGYKIAAAKSAARELEEVNEQI